MKRRIRTLAIQLAALSILALSACGDEDTSPAVAADCQPQHTFSTLEEGKLTVSVYVSPPYTEQKGDTFEGIDGSIVNRIAEMECLDVEAVPVAGAGLIASVQSNRADLAIGGVYRTPERAKTLELTDTMYRDGMSVVSKDGAASVEELAGKTVGVIQGYLWNEDLQKVLGQDAVRVFQSSDGMIADLANGRLDAAILTTAEAAVRVQQNAAAGLQATEFAADPKVPSSTAPGEVVIAVAKNNKEMTSAFNADIASLIDDGTIGRILTENGMSAD